MLEQDTGNTTITKKSFPSSMARYSGARGKPISAYFKAWSLYLGAATVVSMLLLLLWSNASSRPSSSADDQDQIDSFSIEEIVRDAAPFLRADPENATFYDDPQVKYSLGTRLTNWDEKRMEWLEAHPTYAARAKNRVVMATGSPAKPCKHPLGDNFLLRAFKNKVDYCRIHGYDIYYDTVSLHPKMSGKWRKLPAVKAVMMAHPEAEWIWWVDSDAVITDMEFEVPLERYDRKKYNVVVHGAHGEVVEKRSWEGLKTGVLLVRNCQWSMNFLEKWAETGPISKDFPGMGPIQREVFKGDQIPDPDDQTGLAYLLLTDPSLQKYVHLEEEYYLAGNWLDIVPTLSNITDMYTEIERGDGRLRRRHAEKVSLQYGAFRERHLAKAGRGKGSWRRPFVTQFSGCQICSSGQNAVYRGQPCWASAIRAINFADNQILRTFGFIHPNLLDFETVSEVAFNFPDDGPW